MYVSPTSHWRTEVSLIVFLRTYASPSHYVYGYEIDEVEAVKHLVKTSPEWARSYSLIDNHFEAMDAVAKELSDKCDLTLHALPLWVGGGYMNCGIVFFDNSMAPANRTSGDVEKLAKLERLLESIGILKTPKANFELLCSAAYEAYPFEPPEIAEREPPSDWERNRGYEIVSFIREFRKCPPYEQKSEKRSREERDSGGGEQPPVRKRGDKSEVDLTSGHSRRVLSSRVSCRGPI